MNRKAIGKFYYYYSAYNYLFMFGDYCWSIVILPWVSGKYISNEKKRNIVDENGNNMSLSPVALLKYPNLAVK